MDRETRRSSGRRSLTFTASFDDDDVRYGKGNLGVIKRVALTSSKKKSKASAFDKRYYNCQITSTSVAKFIRESDN